MMIIPQKVNELLNVYFKLFEEKLPNLLQDYYIYGSVSLGAFDYGYSDIDFIAVMKRAATEVDIAILKEIHGAMRKKFPKTDLMGMYLTNNDLQLHNQNTKSCPCFIDGVFKGLEKFEKNSIDAYQLKKYGICMKGQNVSELDYIVDWDILIHDMRDNLNSYWLNWRNRCEKLFTIKYIGSFV
ncbi:MAG: hypothetical protein K0Q99_2272, partial [Clostridia bacterium]|nr:hypothetical protein [Clostridia bacterium]